MRKGIFTIIASITVLACVLTLSKRKFVPYEEVLTRQINSSALHTYQDTDFNTEIKVPDGFTLETDTAGADFHYTRYACYPNVTNIDAKGQLTLEYAANITTDNGNWTEKTDSVRLFGNYIKYSKSVKSQGITFTFSLTYPEDYTPCVTRLKNEVSSWKAFCPKRPQMKGTIALRHQCLKSYHSGFTTD